MLSMDMNNFGNYLDGYVSLSERIVDREKDSVQMGFYVISEQTFTFRQITAEEVMGTEGVNRLNAWKQEDRLIAAYQKGNEIFAFTSPGITEALKGRSLTIGDKKVVVRSLSDSQYHSMIADFVGTLLKLNKELNSKMESNNARALPGGSTYVKGNVGFTKFFRVIETGMHKMKQKVLSQWAKDIREQGRLSKEHNERQEFKKQRLEHSELEKKILKEEIAKSELKSEELLKSIVAVHLQ